MPQVVKTAFAVKKKKQQHGDQSVVYGRKANQYETNKWKLKSIRDMAEAYIANVTICNVIKKEKKPLEY